MRVIETGLPGVLVIEPRVADDERGFFLETFRRSAYAAAGIVDDFVQDAHSGSRPGVLRGLHYQVGKPQAKLVRAIRGEAFDVAVDVRAGSPTFGRWTSVRLSAENRRQVYIPAGFAHGFYALGDGVELLYRLSEEYAPERERGVAWDDPDLAIAWPLAGPPTLSPRDAAFAPLRGRATADLPTYPTTDRR